VTSAALPPIGKERLRAALSGAGAAPRRRWGQNFLLDDGLLAAIVRDAGVGPGETVLEVGPGPGLLTRHLRAAGARVVAVEIDAAMRQVAGQLVEPELWSGVEWLAGDVLERGRRVAPAVREVLPRCDRLVANLPYQVAASLLLALDLETRPPPVRVVMVQREVAERVLARPGTRAWGPLGVVSALTCRARRLRKVPPGAFWPAPKVESTVLRLDRRGAAPGPDDLARLLAFLGLAFHNRRKRLPNSLAEATGRKPAEIIEAMGLGEKFQKDRAEGLEALQLCALSQAWTESALGERRRP